MSRSALEKIAERIINRVDQEEYENYEQRDMVIGNILYGARMELRNMGMEKDAEELFNIVWVMSAIF